MSAVVSHPPLPVLSWPAVKFRRAVRAAMVAASTDKDRPHLCGICIRRENGVLTISGTDGTWVFRWTESEGQTNEEGDVSSRQPFQCVVPRRTMESFADATKKHLELERILLVGSGHSWQLQSILDVVKIEFMQVAESYPPLDDVIPKMVAPTCSSIGVGADLLKKVASAFVLATDDPSTTVFWQLSGDAMSPLVCTDPLHEELLAVVMPRRPDGASANALPEKARADASGAAPS